MAVSGERSVLSKALKRTKLVLLEDQCVCSI